MEQLEHWIATVHEPRYLSVYQYNSAKRSTQKAIDENLMDEKTRIEAEAAAFRRLVQHLRDHPEVQNIELMVLADFCRNCLAKWYRAAAEEQGAVLDYAAAQEAIYGMPYGEWKARYQAEATPEQLRLYEERQQRKAAAKSEA